MKKEDLIKFYFTHKAQVFLAAVALASLFLSIFVIYPQMVKLIGNQSALGDLNKRSKFLESKVLALQSYDSEDLSSKLSIILATLPADKDFGNILGLLQQLAVQSGFSTTSISFGRSGGQVAGVGNFEVNLDIKGSKAGFQTLLDNLANTPRLVRVNSIDASSKGDSPVLEAALGIEAFYAQLPKEFGGVDSPLPELSQKDEELILRLEELGQTAYPPSTSSAVESPRGKANPFE